MQYTPGISPEVLGMIMPYIPQNIFHILYAEIVKEYPVFFLQELMMQSSAWNLALT